MHQRRFPPAPMLDTDLGEHRSLAPIARSDGCQRAGRWHVTGERRRDHFGKPEPEALQGGV